LTNSFTFTTSSYAFQALPRWHRHLQQKEGDKIGDPAAKPHTASGSQRLHVQGAPGRANERGSRVNMQRCSRSEHF